ncbi:MAG: sensor signal transduction histidine kinase [Candidatus Taylorbacteria bacterium]|nr:sensor signal transduction histidine kinase [Candidatus Taylorbacteria bacterium]
MNFINSFFSNPGFCSDPTPHLFLFADKVPPLVYYSHLPITIISFFLGLFILLKDPKALPNRILFSLTLAFSAWVFLDSIFWASNRGDVIMFVWSLQILVEPLIYISALYLIDVLVKKRDITFKKKLLIALVYLPIVILVPTSLTLSGFNTGSCLSEEGPIALYYTYGVELFYLLWILYFSVKEVIKEKTGGRREIIMLSTGIIALLLCFSIGNIISSSTEDWTYAQIGLFTMPVFFGFLIYSIVKFKTFNIKLLATQALITGTAILIGAQLFFPSSVLDVVLTTITFITFLISGVFLVRSVKREVEQREKIEQLATGLQKANNRLTELDKQKSEFVSFATHQLRAPLTAMKGYASMILEGDLGTMGDPLREAVSRIFESSKTLTNIVDDYLNVSRIELGTMKYTLDKLDLNELVKSVIGELRPNIDAKKDVAFSFSADPGDYIVSADRDKFKQVLANVIDNSLKYTPKGFVNVSLERIALPAGPGATIRFMVKDNGVGIAPEVMPKLFNKFSRANNASAVNIHGTGLGLFVAKDVVLAHHGKIWAESEGEGKGSAFIVELAAA